MIYIMMKISTILMTANGSKNRKSSGSMLLVRSVRTNIPKNYKMHKIFNSNTVKISYSCMKNISCMISSHNRNISNPIVKSYGCNYRVESKCLLNSECINPKLSTEPIFLIIKTATKIFALV